MEKVAVVSLMNGMLLFFYITVLSLVGMGH